MKKRIGKNIIGNRVTREELRKIAGGLNDFCSGGCSSTFTDPGTGLCGFYEGGVLCLGRIVKTVCCPI